MKYKVLNNKIKENLNNKIALRIYESCLSNIKTIQTNEFL